MGCIYEGPPDPPPTVVSQGNEACGSSVCVFRDFSEDSQWKTCRATEPRPPIRAPSVATRQLCAQALCKSRANDAIFRSQIVFLPLPSTVLVHRQMARWPRGGREVVLAEWTLREPGGHAQAPR